MSHPDAVIDFQRGERIGLEEAVYCSRKTAHQIGEILARFKDRDRSCLLTRLNQDKIVELSAGLRELMDYDPISRTAFFLQPDRLQRAGRVAIISGGTSDADICAEASRTLRFYGEASTLIQDVGVTGLWRLEERLEEIRSHPIV
ncbi:MAG: circadian phase modifier CpmA, partial [Gammaproteobacteria bacterium]|nr:circadian phase modifier CpmA [Gammaproteobacteria bacterium]